MLSTHKALLASRQYTLLYSDTLTSIKAYIAHHGPDKCLLLLSINTKKTYRIVYISK